MTFFLLELYLVIDLSNLANENDVTELSELFRRTCKNNLLSSASISFGSIAKIS